MPRSSALHEFEQALQIAEALLELDRQHHSNPPRHSEQKAVEGLRGGAAVFMVAAFETYLREAVQEHLSRLTTLPLSVAFDDLPEPMRVHSVFQTLERAMTGPAFQERVPKAQRLTDIDTASRMVISKVVNPTAFSEIGSNPSPARVREMFKRLDIRDVFDRIKVAFDIKWGTPTARTFIPDKLEEIVGRRHVVAHTADALNIARKDLRESIKFLRTLTSLLDVELDNHINNILQ